MFRFISIFKFILIIVLFIAIPSIRAQEFYDYIGKSKDYLLSHKGTPSTVSSLRNLDTYYYSLRNNTAIGYMVNKSSGKITMALLTIPSISKNEATLKKSSYISELKRAGFHSNSNNNSGMTQLNKGSRQIQIAIVKNNSGSYDLNLLIN